MRKAIVILGVLLVLAPCANAQMVGSTNRQQGGYYDPGYGQNDAGRPRGALLHLEVGLPCAVSLGYQVSPVLMVGAGIGVNFLMESLPVYGEIRLNTPHDRIAGFLDVKAGYDLGGWQGGAFMGEVGMMYGDALSIGAGIGYTDTRGDGLMFLLSVSYDLQLNKLFY